MITSNTKLKQTAFLQQVCWIIALLFLLKVPAYAQVDTGGPANTSNHNKQVIGYITNWDAWKGTNAGVPAQGALNHLNIDYSKYTVLNYSFFGVAVDGSLHSGDHRNKNIYQPGSVQQPADLFFLDIYSSWDLHLLFGELEPLQYINEQTKARAEAQGFQVEVGGSSWYHPGWGLGGSLPLPLHKEDGAPGVLELAHQNGVKVVASIGGWSMSKHFPEMAADPQKRQRFINDCKRLINSGFDGIDLDWEFVGPFAGMNFTGTQADFANFTTLIQELRAAIGPDKLITAAFSADPRKLEGFQWATLMTKMDYVNFMTYDFNGGWSNIAGHNAPVYSYDGAEVSFFNWQATLSKLIELGVPKSKICLGMPFYGRGVITDGPAVLNAPTKKRSETVQPDGPITTCADYTNWARDVYDGTPNYFYIKQQALGAGSGWTKHWDDQAKVPYLTKDNFFLSYDDEQSIGIKSQYIVDNDLGGVIIWTVFGDLEFSGTPTSFGTKLKRWSNVKSPLVNKINEVFANGGTGNKAPIVSITAPASNANFNVGTTIKIDASASDSDGTVSKVEFYVGSAKVGEDNTSPYSVSWTPQTAGMVSITAKATDNLGAAKTSSAVSVTIKSTGGDNQAPSVNITAPVANTKYKAGVNITISANASDNDGTVANVEFFAGTIKVGEDNTSPYSVVWSNVAAGSYKLTAKATDDKSAATTSAEVAIIVETNSGGGCTVAAWESSKAYSEGNQVSRSGNIYEAKWWTQGDDPVQKSGEWDVWKLIGSCDDGGNNPDPDPGNTAPSVTLTSPTSGAKFTAPASITISANASDSDGTVVKVEFYNGSIKLGEDTSSPYSFTWSNVAAGTYSVTAKAIDDKGATATSTTASITVGQGGDTGTCDAPQYTENGGYSAGSKVQNTGNLYECRPHPYSGWCNGAAWAYEPGKGAHWEDAWTLVGACDGGDNGGNKAPTVGITSPMNNASFTAGATIQITASATDSDGTVKKVEFFRNGVKVGEDASQPFSFSWTNAAAGFYTLTAKATDNAGAATTSTGVSVQVNSDNGGGGNGSLPKRILVGYWHNFDNGSGTLKLRNVSPKWDVVNIAFAEPTTPQGATMQFTPDPAIYPNVQDFKNDVAYLKSQGKKVLISIGGANGAIHVDDAQDAQNFASSMISIINEYGFSGLDIDLEGSSLSLASGDNDFRNPVSPRITHFISGVRTILNSYTTDFVLSMAPETAFVQGGYSVYAGSYGAYLPVIYAFRNEMDYIHVQHYNSGCMLGLDGICYSQGTADFQVAMAEMLLQGFPVAGNPVSFPALRPDQVAIGLPASPSAAGGGYTTPAEVHKALDYLIKGISYGGKYTLRNPAGYANFRGLMTWSINWDIVNNYQFSNSHRAYLDALDAGASSAVTSTTVQSSESMDRGLSGFTVKEAQVSFELEEDAYATLVIYNAMGTKVAVLANQHLKKGVHVFDWDIRNASGGLYFYQLTIGHKKEVLKVYKQ